MNFSGTLWSFGTWVEEKSIISGTDPDKRVEPGSLLITFPQHWKSFFFFYILFVLLFFIYKMIYFESSVCLITI